MPFLLVNLNTLSISVMKGVTFTRSKLNNSRVCLVFLPFSGLREIDGISNFVVKRGWEPDLECGNNEDQESGSLTDLKCGVQKGPEVKRLPP